MARRKQGSIIKRGTRYEARTTLPKAPWEGDAKRRTKSRWFDTKAEATRGLNQMLRDADAAPHDPVAAGRIKPRRRLRLDTYAEDWIADVLPGMDIAPKTRDTYESAIRARVLPRLGGILLGDVTARDVHNMGEDLLDAGYATASVRRAVLLTRTILDAAAEDGARSRNQCRRHRRRCRTRPLEVHDPALRR